MTDPTDSEVRAALDRWLLQQRAVHGDVLDATLLKRGFECAGERLPLIVQQGIYKPRFLDAALSLRTSFRSPYADHFEGEDTLVYSYQGEDPDAWDNVAVRRAMETGVPLVYLHAVWNKPARYGVVWPVFVVGDDPDLRAFRVQADTGAALAGGPSATGALEGANLVEERVRRAYGTRLVRTRLHQDRFRERVLSAYRQQCAMCRLRHRDLLDAAHIDRDSDPEGEPVVTNGMSLCKIHHAAFDASLLSFRPEDYSIALRADILEEDDGPMLQHGLKALHGVRLQLPRRVLDRPDPARLRRHWAKFEAGR